MKQNRSHRGPARRGRAIATAVMAVAGALLLVTLLTRSVLAQDVTNTGPVPIQVNANTTVHFGGNFTNNSSSTVTNDGNIAVVGALNFQNGKIDEPNNGIVIFRDGATAANAADASHVDGMVRKIGNDAFTFPTGDGSQVGPVGISAPAAIGDQIDARYWLANPQTDAGTALGAGLRAVSAVEYWNVAGTPAVNLTLHWDSGSNISALTSTLANLRVVGWNGTQWIALGNNSTTGTTSAGTITANGIAPNSYSAYTFAAVNAAPTITQPTGAPVAISVPETSTAVVDVNTTDDSGVEGNGTLIYTLSGPDAAQFTVNANGNLAFLAAPDFETPGSAASSNVYSVTVTVADSGGLTDTQGIQVTVTDVVESAPGIAYKLIYNATTNRYEVWMRPTVTPGAPNQTLTAQVTIKAPHVAGSGAFTPTNVLPYTSTLWTNSSVVRAPAEASSADYLSFDLDFPTGNTGAFGWQAGVERLVFSFQNGGVCAGPVTLMANNDPFNTLPNSTGTNPGNAIDVLALGNDPGNDYLGDYSSGAATCPAASAVTLPMKLFLQGAYDSASGLLRDDLRSKSLIPTSAPYTATATTTAGVFAGTGNDAIVDWVLVELHDSTTPATVVARQSALLQRDGDVVGVNGTSTLTFTVSGSSYYVAVKHRNHLGTMTAAPVTLSGSTPLVDFTTMSATYGSYGQAQSSGRYLLWMGDGNGDGRVIVAGPGNDRNGIFAEVLGAPANGGYNANYIVTGYSKGDINLDGRVIAAGPGNDLNPQFYVVFTHAANGSAAANYVVQGQVP